ncbi:MAG TPA: N-6 DNA methylase, partial [Candidatus Limnocylindria bacterium]|nr:N-6 DNA methylase [Candidatus Limnocylindria bacterium]
MANSQLIEALGYRDSRKFLPATEADRLPASELSFAIRHTAQVCEEKSEAGEDCSFLGTYILQEEAGAPAVPVVYVFETDSDSTAKAIHRIVWNQNLVPFLIVASRSTVRVYPGFSFSRDEDNALVSVANIAAVLHDLSAFNASSIDDGTIWQRWGHAANPSERVDERLLSHLKDLDQCLQKEGMNREASHGLIGKFVYLYYLRHRGILSDRKLEKWSIAPQDLFSRNATLKAFRAVNDELQGWLNGSVFQLGDEALSNISQAQLRLAAGVFAGDSASGQLHLDFQAYDFSHIPIETLSCVYEQFLHDAEETDGETRGETLGAYYTPIPLADYVISEMERKRPLKEGMRVLDPSCGSGAFLVQCYRRLIEKRMRSEKRCLKTKELRELLTNHIFGIDRDDDACRVAELSLILTLLDYVSPPDLENTTFKLPSLRGTNIFKDDFFDSTGEWQARLRDQRFDWVVGNPPWAEVKGVPTPDHEHFYAGKWISSHKTTHPTGGNQISEAFLWEVGEHIAANGVVGLLVPAMTWFKKESVAFRKNFFSKREVWCLTNFANLAY